MDVLVYLFAACLPRCDPKALEGRDCGLFAAMGPELTWGLARTRHERNLQQLDEE